MTRTSAIDIRELGSDQIHYLGLTQFFEDIFLTETKREFGTRVQLLSVAVAAAVLSATFLLGLRQKEIGVWWLSIGSIALLLNLLLVRAKGVNLAETLACLTSLLCFVWWGVLVTHLNTADLSSQLVAAYLIYGFCALPVMPARKVWWTTGFLLVLPFICSLSRLPLATLPIWYLLSFVAIRQGAILYLDLILRANALLWSGLNESAWNGTTPVRLLTLVLARAYGGNKSLLCLGDEQPELLRGEEFEEAKVDTVVSRSLIQRAVEKKEEIGFLSARELGEQFDAPLRELFGRVPLRLFYVRFETVVEGKEQKAVLFIPTYFELSFLGLNRANDFLRGLLAGPRAAMIASRNRFFSSSAFIDTQRSISEQENELNQIIHHVNNVAQDIAVQCEELRQRLKDASSGPGAVGCSEVDRIELFSRGLAVGVSDVKLVRELLRIRAIERVEKIDLAPILEDLESWAKERAVKEKQEFNLVRELPAGIGISVISREFLETAFRLLLRIASKNLKESGKVQLRVFENGQFISIEVSDSGRAIAEDSKIGVLSDKPGALTKEFQYLRAIRRLALLSRGRMEFEPGDETFVNRIRVDFPKISLAENTTVIAGQWALLIDDNNEVTTFYARVAEAMSLRYFTAASVAEAQKIVKDQGRPRVVVTDLQLGDTDSIGLIYELRQQFGQELPILVVTGNTDDQTVERIKKAGGTKFLFKPIGRKRLFSEIREVLV